MKGVIIRHGPEHDPTPAPRAAHAARKLFFILSRYHCFGCHFQHPDRLITAQQALFDRGVPAVPQGWGFLPTAVGRTMSKVY